MGCVDFKVSEDSLADHGSTISKYSRVNPSVVIKLLGK